MAEFGQSIIFVAGIASFFPLYSASTANLSLLDSDTNTYLMAAWEAEQRGDLVQAARYAKLIAPPDTVTFRVQFDGSADKRSAELSELVQEAIAEWGSSGVRFAEADAGNASDAILTITFRDRVNGRRGAVAGVTRSHRSLSPEGVVTVKCEIEVSTSSPYGGRLPKDAILKTLLHELGHFLGLRDSADPSDIMGPVRIGAANAHEISDAQRQAVVLLCGEAWRLSNMAPEAATDARSRKPRVFTFPTL